MPHGYETSVQALISAGQIVLLLSSAFEMLSQCFCNALSVLSRCFRSLCCLQAQQVKGCIHGLLLGLFFSHKSQHTAPFDNEKYRIWLYREIYTLSKEQIILWWRACVFLKTEYLNVSYTLGPSGGPLGKLISVYFILILLIFHNNVSTDLLM